MQEVLRTRRVAMPLPPYALCLIPCARRRYALRRYAYATLYGDFRCSAMRIAAARQLRYAADERRLIRRFCAPWRVCERCCAGAIDICRRRHMLRCRRADADDAPHAALMRDAAPTCRPPLILPRCHTASCCFLLLYDAHKIFHLRVRRYAMADVYYDDAEPDAAAVCR